MTKLRAIRQNAFYGCDNFRSFNFYNPLRVIENQAFALIGTPDINVTLKFNSELTELGSKVFNNGVCCNKIIFGDKNSPSQLKQDNNKMKDAYCINHQTDNGASTIVAYVDIDKEDQWRKWIDGELSNDGYAYKFIVRKLNYNKLINPPEGADYYL